MNKHKICSKRKIKKTVSEFNKDASKKDGLYSFCRKCQNKQKENYTKTAKAYIWRYKNECFLDRR
ncbi:MAG: hypothetical protein ACTSXT_08135 [Candidatus Helarchaeota archaeon]